MEHRDAISLWFKDDTSVEMTLELSFKGLRNKPRKGGGGGGGNNILNKKIACEGAEA